MIDSIEFKDDGVKIILHCTITSKEIMDINTKLYQHNGFESCRYQLWIFKSVKDVVMSASEIQQIAECDKKESKRNSNIKIAIVSDSPLMFGMGRMYEAFYGKGPWKTMVFYDLDKAEQWLNS